MIDFETDLRDRLDRTASEVSVPPDLLTTVERRVVAQRRRTTALRVAGALVVVALAAGIALAATGGDDEREGPTSVATDPPASTEATTIASAPPPEPGWVTMADAPLSPRTHALVLAMGDEVLVYGGMGVGAGTPDDDGDVLPATPTDGAVYDPVADSWRTIADPPLEGHATGVWTGTEAILVSGGPPLSTPDAEGGPPAAAAFDPATDTWRTLATPPAELAPHGIATVWTGTHVVAVQRGTAFPDEPDTTTVGVYDPATDTWTSGPSTDGVEPSAVVWTGTEAIVVGTADTDPSTDVEDEVLVRAFDPAAGTWRSIPWGLSGGSRVGMAVAWTGDRLFVGGGMTFAGQEEDRSREAALLDPVTGTWTPATPAPTAFFGPDAATAIWTGDRVLTLGGGEGGAPLSIPGPNAALAYDPATDTWTEGPARPGEGEWGAGWAWAADRVVVPLGIVPLPANEDVFDDSNAIPGGATYTP
jgi:hypothetical protein